jgi:hypothetical protein
MVPKRADSLLTQPIQNHDDVGKRLALRWTIPVLVSVVQTPGLATFPTTELPRIDRSAIRSLSPLLDRTPDSERKLANCPQASPVHTDPTR